MPSATGGPLRRPGWRYLVWLAALAALAFAVRLVAVLRGGGLYGRIGYDGSVYYASASALTYGLLPYRDFLFLHPPGIALALLPFATLGRFLGDADGLAAARLAWFGMGAVSAVLVHRIVRACGFWPAVAAAVFYAVFVPAVVSEHTTSLEALGSVCLLGAVALLTSVSERRTGSVAVLIAAGALLGLSTGTKIWGVAVVLVLVGWTARHQGRRQAALVLMGAVGAAGVLCLPFFLAAPRAMWRMVVVDQLGRGRFPDGVAARMVDIAGLSQLEGTFSPAVLAFLAVALLVGVVVLARHDPIGRLATLLLAVTTAVLLSTPPWSVAYTGLAAPAIALLVGCAAARLAGAARHLQRVMVAAAVIGLVAYAGTSLAGLTFGSRFPGRSFERILAQTPGCVTSDDPIVLIETGALRRNLSSHCPVVLDMSGYSYDLRPAADLHLRRPRNDQWQHFVHEYLGSGTTTVLVRFRTAPGLSRTTSTTVSDWPVLAEVGDYQVRRPEPRTTSPTR